MDAEAHDNVRGADGPPFRQVIAPQRVHGSVHRLVPFRPGREHIAQVDHLVRLLHLGDGEGAAVLLPEFEAVEAEVEGGAAGAAARMQLKTVVFLVG